MSVRARHTIIRLGGNTTVSPVLTAPPPPGDKTIVAAPAVLGSLPPAANVETGVSRTVRAVSAGMGGLTIPSPSIVTTTQTGTVIETFQDAGAIINAGSAGEQFFVKGGTWNNKYLTLKANMGVFAFSAASKPLFIGENNPAIGTPFIKGAAGGVGGVVVDGLRIQNYHPADPAWVNMSTSASRRNPSVDCALLNSPIIRNCEIFDCGAGIALGNGGLAENNWQHHLHHLSYRGIGGGSNFTIKGGIVEHTNRKPNGAMYFDPGWEAVFKIVRCVDFTIDGLTARFNKGNAIWCDIENNRGLIKNCVSHNNDRKGIFWEISFSVTIEDNTCYNNCLVSGFGQIHISNGFGSSAVPILVRRNRCYSGPADREIAVESNGGRTDTPLTPKSSQYVRITDNVVGDPNPTPRIVQNIYGGAPTPMVGLIVTGNHEPDGTPVGIS